LPGFAGRKKSEVPGGHLRGEQKGLKRGEARKGGRVRRRLASGRGGEGRNTVGHPARGIVGRGGKKIVAFKSG